MNIEKSIFCCMNTPKITILVNFRDIYKFIINTINTMNISEQNNDYNLK